MMNPAKQVDDAALDQWLRASLRARYAETLREPVPEALLELLRAYEA